VQDDINGMTTATLFVERVHFHIIHFTQVARRIMLPLMRVGYNSLRVLELQLSASSSHIVTIQPKFVSQF